MCDENNRAEQRYKFFFFLSYHFLKIDQFVYVVWISLIDECHVWTWTETENMSVISDLIYMTFTSKAV